MTLAGGTPDPRPRLGAALDQVAQQVHRLEPTDLGRPTPCAEYDVRTLVAHLVAVLRKITAAHEGGDTTEVPDPAEDVAGNEIEVFRRARSDLEQAWAPRADLVENYTMAWGTMVGHELLDAYTHEFTVHSWDLAQATGRGDLNPELAREALDWFMHNVPTEDRSEDGPFAAAVEVSDDTDLYTQLAAYVGRSV